MQKFDPQDQTMIPTGGETIKIPTQHNSPYLVIIYPREMRSSYRLDQKVLSIGRSKDCDISINDNWISRTHCSVSLIAGRVRVQDLGSTNGTFIDGQQIDDAILAPNSRLQLGQIVFKVEFKDHAEVAYDQKLFEDATTDPLTKVPNRRWFLDRAQTEIALAKREDRQVNLIMLDIDFFKKVNDTYGHQAGDFILREVAAILHREKREEDLLGRYGGEEFILLLREISKKEAFQAAERMRLAVANSTLRYEKNTIEVNISMGLCSQSGENIISLNDLIKDADEALYQAKRKGRNKVILAP